MSRRVVATDNSLPLRHCVDRLVFSCSDEKRDEHFEAIGVGHIEELGVIEGVVPPVDPDRVDAQRLDRREVPVPHVGVVRCEVIPKWLERWRFSDGH